MRRISNRLLSALVLLVLTAPVCVAGNYSDAVEAMRRGDDEAAVELIREAAKAGDRSAQKHLEYLYGATNSNKKSMSKAASEDWLVWFKAAAETGDPVAQLKLAAELLERKKTRLEGAEWLESSAKHDVVTAQYRYADLLHHGPRTLSDSVAAAEWYERAAEGGHYGAQHRLGEMLYRGKEVPKDLARAHYYLSLASRGGAREPRVLLDEVATKISSEGLLASRAEQRRFEEREKPNPVELNAGVYLAGFGGVSTPLYRYGVWPQNSKVPSAGHYVVDLRVTAEGKVTDAWVVDASHPKFTGDVVSWITSHPVTAAHYGTRPVDSIHRLSLSWGTGSRYPWGGFRPGYVGLRSRGNKELYRHRAGSNLN